MAPVILRMDVHCYGCADKIRRVLKNILGVEEVWVSVERGLVVVTGAALDASLLRRKIQKRTKTKRPVSIVSDGMEQPPPQYALPSAGYPYPYYGGHLGHVAYAQPPPAAYPYVGGGGWVPAATAPPQHLLQYVPSEMPVHARHGQYYYMPNEAPLWSNNDYENPNSCCSVQ